MTGHEEHTLTTEEHLGVLGRAIREIRNRRGITQETLGLESDIHRNYVGAMERGEINPSFRIFLKLTRGLDVPLSLLIRVYERRCAEEKARTEFEKRIDRTVREEADVPAQLEEPKPGSRLTFSGQDHAARHMERLGMRIAERDFRTRWGKVDVIAYEDERIVFCDVTTRRFGAASPSKAPPETQRRGVHRTATVWLEQTGSQRPTVSELRFDAIDVTINAADELVGLEHRVLATERTDELTADSDPNRGNR